MALQNSRSPDFECFKILNFGVPRQNGIWMQPSRLIIENTIRGRCWLRPNSSRDESCESMDLHGLSMHQKCSNHTLTNLLFGLCRFVWIIEPLITHPSPHPKVPTRPFTPKMLWAREHTPTPYSFIVFTFKLTFESFKECESASIILFKPCLMFDYYNHHKVNLMLWVFYYKITPLKWCCKLYNSDYYELLLTNPPIRSLPTREK
jgi:hypothetical protein